MSPIETASSTEAAAGKVHVLSIGSMPRGACRIRAVRHRPESGDGCG